MGTKAVKRVCGWCGILLGIAEWPDNGIEETTHGMCNKCLGVMLADVAGVTVPHIDEVLLVDCEMASDGKTIHRVRQHENGYVGSAELFPLQGDLDSVRESQEMWLKCHRQLSSIRKRARRARLAQSPLTRKYLEV